MQKAQSTSFLRQRRSAAIRIQLPKAMIILRDQQPLHQGNMTLLAGLSFEDVLQMLNEKVFFWAGTKTAPVSYGQRHFQGYAKEKPAVLRISTRDLYKANPNVRPHYCRYNSGAPRCNKGLGSPRGPDTFVSSARADYEPSKVAEVIYKTEVGLPQEVEVADSLSGPWRKL
jgi:hypothetical protein